MMKKMIPTLILLSLLLVVVSGCNKTTAKDGVPFEEYILGRWEEDLTIDNDINDKRFIKFKENGNVDEYYGNKLSDEDAYSYKIEGNKVILYYTVVDVDDDGNIVPTDLTTETTYTIGNDVLKRKDGPNTRPDKYLKEGDTSLSQEELDQWHEDLDGIWVQASRFYYIFNRDGSVDYYEGNDYTDISLYEDDTFDYFLDIYGLNLQLYSRNAANAYVYTFTLDGNTLMRGDVEYMEKIE